MRETLAHAAAHYHVPGWVEVASSLSTSPHMAGVSVCVRRELGGKACALDLPPAGANAQEPLHQGRLAACKLAWGGHTLHVVSVHL